MRKYWFVLLLPVLTACPEGGLETSENPDKQTEISGQEGPNILDEVHEISDQKKMDNGLVIKWFNHGEGEPVKAGDCIDIDYKVQLENGEVVDGNHLLKMESMPFIVGFGMQTKGWDLALQEMRVGDFAEILIPSSLARGDKGIKGLIPPNADNVLRIRILSKRKPTREMDGNKVWLLEDNPNNDLKFGEDNRIEFHCWVSSPSNPMYVNTFQNNSPFTLKLEDSGLVPGIKKALINAKKSDRMFVLVPSKEAYGAAGLTDLVKPNEDLLFNILVMDVHK